ncbi:unnamed protein product [Cuscuta epithymum]|uniref:DUF7950 domain-containing protein n=1 Tax=Cuscuta epithymum TaxID=186058 RepID=A0AAV0C2J1_9ASTE|nr:unnamed protein product [Cuscuta epithymum]
MDRRGGCCISRYKPAMGYDTFKVNNIMLRFRPIAPKPAAPGSVPYAPAVQETVKGTRRNKRRYVRSTESTGKISKNSGKKKKAASPAPEIENQYSYGKTESCSSSVSSLERDATVVTLPLLPEKPDRKESPASSEMVERTGSTGSNGPVWLRECHVPAVLRGLGSWVIVEGVTGTWKLDGYSLGRSDREKLMNLERDTCPGLTSDDLNRVTWTNSAYSDMVGLKGGAAAWVVLGDGVLLPATKEAALTCRVRVVTCGGKEESYDRRGGLVVLCDVWRMDGGGFAWRLDTELSLRLGVN